jgi:hypothetical protein
MHERNAELTREIEMRTRILERRLKLVIYGWLLTAATPVQDNF